MQSQSRRIHHCSECGFEGHNSSNSNCPVNRLFYEELRHNTSEEASYFNAERLICHMRNYCAFYGVNGMTRESFISQMIVNMDELCTHLRQFNPRSRARDKIMKSLELVVNYINRKLQQTNGLGPRQYVILANTSEGPFIRLIDITSNMVNESPESTIRGRPLRSPAQNRIRRSRQPTAPRPSPRSNPRPNPSPRPIQQQKVASVYLKECSLVQDLLINQTCQCPICLDDVDAEDVMRTNCNHTYCVTCIKELSTTIKNKVQKPSCPMCRSTITEFKMGKEETLNEMNTYFSTL